MTYVCYLLPSEESNHHQNNERYRLYRRRPSLHRENYVWPILISIICTLCYADVDKLSWRGVSQTVHSSSSVGLFTLLRSTFIVPHAGALLKCHISRECSLRNPLTIARMKGTSHILSTLKPTV